MTGLEEIKLGTDPKEGWRYYAIHLTGSQILKEFFLVANYKRCINNSFNYHEQVENGVSLMEEMGKPVPHKEAIIKSSKELSDWAKNMEVENYHDLYVNAFIGMWASFESGIENIIKDYIVNDKAIAKALSSKFKQGKYDLDKWPWSEEESMGLAQKIDGKAKNSIENGGIRFGERVQIIFSWLCIHFELNETEKEALDEANRIRNILLHRYGKVSSKDAQDFPVLSEWVDKVMPFDKQKFSKYHQGIVAVLTGAVKNA